MLFFLFISLSLASQQIEKYCFASKQEAQKAQSQIEFILIKNQDKTLMEGDCLTIAVDGTRVDLVTRWIRSHYPNARMTFSSSSPTTEECKIKFKKLSQKQLQNMGAGINQQKVSVQASGQIEEAQDIRMIRTLAGKEAVLELDNFRLKLTCTFHSSYHYSLELSGSTVPRPLRTTTTQTPYGSTTVTESPAQTIESLNTTVSLRKNEEINLGQIFKDYDNKNKDLNINNPSLQKNAETSLSQWFISLY